MRAGKGKAMLTVNIKTKDGQPLMVGRNGDGRPEVWMPGRGWLDVDAFSYSRMICAAIAIGESELRECAWCGVAKRDEPISHSICLAHEAEFLRLIARSAA